METARTECLDSRPVLDHGRVALVEYWGGDAGVVRAARTCYASEARGPGSDARLLARLIRQGHLTPFRFAGLTMDVDLPLFVRSQWERHAVGWGYCEQSFRYVTPEELTFYLPGSPEAPAWHFMQKVYQGAAYTYRESLADGVAPEQARLVLPQATYTHLTATCTVQALMGWLRQRLDNAAQCEHRQYAEAVLDMWGGVMPITQAAFLANLGGKEGG